MSKDIVNITSLTELGSESNLLSAENVRAGGTMDSISNELSTLTSFESNNFYITSNATSTEIVRGLLERNTLSSNLSTEIARAEARETTLDNTLINDSNSLSTNYSELSTNDYIQSAAINNDYSDLNYLIDDISSENIYISTEYSTTRANNNLTRNTNYTTLSNTVSTNFYENVSDLRLKVNTEGGVLQGHLKIEDSLYLGPYWRIKDEGTKISFQYYNVDSDTWVTTIPFFSS